MRDQKIKKYCYGFGFPFLFKKCWFWFTNPFDVKGAAMVNFFSYNKIEKEGFKRKEGLTTIINLDQNLDEIWFNMRKKFIRKQIRRGEKNGIVVKIDNNFKEFRKIYFNFRKQKDLPKDNYKMFVQNGILFSAYFENKMLAGGIFISNGINIRAWVLSSKRHSNNSRTRERIGQANRMIIWEAIKYAKNSEHKIFDLGGIDIDSKDKSQVSLAEFKESFGGDRQKCYYYKIYSKFIKSWIKFMRLIKL